MRCNACGAENPDGAAFCQSCAKPLVQGNESASIQPTAPAKKKSRLGWYIGFGIVGAIVLLSIGAAVWQNTQPQLMVVSQYGTINSRGDAVITVHVRNAGHARGEATIEAVATFSSDGAHYTGSMDIAIDPGYEGAYTITIDLPGDQYLYDITGTFSVDLG